MSIFIKYKDEQYSIFLNNSSKEKTAGSQCSHI